MKKRIENLLLLLYFSLFSFGQLPAFIFEFYTTLPFNIHLTDIALLVLLALNLKNIFKIKHLYIFLFSSVFALTIFALAELQLGIIYLIRIIAIINIGFVFRDKLTKKEINPQFLLNILFINGIAIALWGWLQYILFPDTRQMAIYAWDDHLYRLIGTFFDPAFTGILLTLGLIVTCHSLIKKINVKYVLIFAILVSALLFTYSRASYLAFFIGFAVLVYKKLPITKGILFGVLMVIGVFLLPRPGGEGVKLERVYTLVLKVENTARGIDIVSKSPVFGYGFNNICAAQRKYLNTNIPEDSHSCSGFDNSVVFLLGCFGIVGVMALGNILKDLNQKLHPQKRQLMYASVAAVFTHGMFTNTFVYPWVLAWMVTLYVWASTKG